MLYAERWQVETAYLHLKKTLRGARRVLRGQSVTLARQEAWAFLLVHNMIATLAARAAALASIDPDEISFTAVLGLVRAHLQAGTRCPALRPAPGDPLARLLADVIAHPRNRAGNGPPVAPRSSGAPGTPRKPATPSRSRRQISRDGTNLSEVKGSGNTAGQFLGPSPGSRRRRREVHGEEDRVRTASLAEATTSAAGMITRPIAAPLLFRDRLPGRALAAAAAGRFLHRVLSGRPFLRPDTRASTISPGPSTPDQPARGVLRRPAALRRATGSW